MDDNALAGGAGGPYKDGPGRLLEQDSQFERGNFDASISLKDRISVSIESKKPMDKET